MGNEQITITIRYHKNCPSYDNFVYSETQSTINYLLRIGMISIIDGIKIRS